MEVSDAVGSLLRSLGFVSDAPGSAGTSQASRWPLQLVQTEIPQIRRCGFQKIILKFHLFSFVPPSGFMSMAGETGRDREGRSPPGPINSISWVGPRGTQYIAKIDPFYFSWTVFQQFQ